MKEKTQAEKDYEFARQAAINTAVWNAMSGRSQYIFVTVIHVILMGICATVCWGAWDATRVPHPEFFVKMIGIGSFMGFGMLLGSLGGVIESWSQMEQYVKDFHKD